MAAEVESSFRPGKRAKFEGTTAPAVALQPLQFMKLTPAPLSAAASPAAPHSNRLIAELSVGSGDDATPLLSCWKASGSHLTRVAISLPSPRTQAVDMGKEGVMLPVTTQAPAEQPVPAVVDQHEVQALALAVSPSSSTWLGSIDSHGHACLYNSSATDAGKDQQTCLQLAPSRAVLEAGWAGIAVSVPSGGGGEPVCGTAMAFARQLCWHQGSKCMRCWSSQQVPSALMMVPHSEKGNSGPTAGLLVCAEQNMVSVWDARQPSAVQRLLVGAGGCPLFSLAWCNSQGGMLGAAGAERSVILIDARKWRVAHKWAGAAKYSIHYLQFSQAAPSYCYVAGQDLEFVAGRWDGQGGGSAGNANSNTGGHGRAVGPAGFVAGELEEPMYTTNKGNVSFRGDSRWLGMTTAQGTSRDVVLTRSQTDAVYVLEMQAV